MKATAIVFEADRKAILEDIEMPSPTDTDLIVRATMTGVSVGTERWALTSQRPEMKYPNIPGYLGVGIVEEVGSSFEGINVGDRIFYFACRLIEPYASNSWMSTHVSRAVVPNRSPADWPPYVCKVPDPIDDASAAMAGLASVSARGIDMIKVTSADLAIVLGLGVIGQSAVQILRAKGARVVAADMLADRVDKAVAAGCEAGVVLDGGPILPQLKGHVPDDGADIVVDTTSVAAVVQQFADLVRMGGQILLQAYYPGLTPFNVDALHAKRPSIQVACAQSREAHEYAQRLMCAGMLKLAPMVTHSQSPHQAPETYQMVVDNPNEFLGIVFDWNKL